MSILSSSRPTDSPLAIDLSTILEPVFTEMGMVEELLSSNLIDDNPFVTELLAQIFKAGGKRIRPGLVLLSCAATSNKQEQNHITLAVLTELIHSASLVHDDVIDKAPLRRGQETVNRKFNDRVAVLVGDLLFAQASICLARLMNPPIVGIYGQVLGDLCAGEIRQMKQQFNCQVNWDAYIHKSVCKTASLFAAGCQSSAILNSVTPDIVDGLKEYGTNLGICFQIIDDLLDVTGNSLTLGKPSGGDLMHGIVTAPVMFILERKDSCAQKLENLITTRKVCEADGITEALQMVVDNGGIDATITLCEKYARKAKDALKVLKPSDYKDSLVSMVDYLLLRTN